MSRGYIGYIRGDCAIGFARALKAVAFAKEQCVDNVNTLYHAAPMNEQPALADINIHLRARPQDRLIIDQAAELVGANRSQFMMASALKEAKNILLDQSTIYMDAKNFKKVMDWMDKPESKTEAAGMKRLLQAKTPWQVD